VRLTIRDNGCGISEAHLKKIFEPFFTTKKEGKGPVWVFPLLMAWLKSFTGKSQFRASRVKALLLW
jgi:signal transduction histidine kinase